MVKPVSLCESNLTLFWHYRFSDVKEMGVKIVRNGKHRGNVLDGRKNQSIKCLMNLFSWSEQIGLWSHWVVSFWISGKRWKFTYSNGQLSNKIFCYPKGIFTDLGRHAATYFTVSVNSVEFHTLIGVVFVNFSLCAGSLNQKSELTALIEILIRMWIERIKSNLVIAFIACYCEIKSRPCNETLVNYIYEQRCY